VDAVGGEPQVITAAGTYQVGMIKVTGYGSREGSPTGPSDDVPNVIFVFEIAGARIVHLGDAGLVSEADALAGIADADVILVNIDGYVSPLDDILPFMQQINAHTIIPVHFSIYPYARWGTDQTLTLDEYLETLPDDVDIVRKDDGELRVTPDMPDQIAALSPTRLLDL
jgi:L-ascorbate metabolism protein UlaG (beta-lactamase superfamily)